MSLFINANKCEIGFCDMYRFLLTPNFDIYMHANRSLTYLGGGGIKTHDFAHEYRRFE